MYAFGLKFILVGDSRVGKSQISRAFTKKCFNHDAQSTVGMEFSTKAIEFEKSVIKAQIWDTAGQERFESMTKAYYRDARGAALVYDITNRQSFLNIRNLWLKQLREHGHESIRLILVGNKIDLVTEGGKSEREVSQAEAMEFAQEMNLDFIETSALTGYCVEHMFRRLVLSVAQLLPQIKVHLELTSLPVGWMIVFEETMKPSLVRQSSQDSSGTGSGGATTTIETPASSGTGVGSSGSGTAIPTVSLERPTIHSKKLLQESRLTLGTAGEITTTTASPMIMARGGSGEETQPHSSSSPNSVGNSSVGVAVNKYRYVNYWTGEFQYELPTEAAIITGLLYAAIPPATNSIDGSPSSSAKMTTRKSIEATGSRPSLDDRALTERSSSAKTIDFRGIKLEDDEDNEGDDIKQRKNRNKKKNSAAEGGEARVCRCNIL